MLTALKILSVPQNCPEVDRIQKQGKSTKSITTKKGIYMEQQGNVAAA